MLAMPWKRCEGGVSGGGKFWPDTGFATCNILAYKLFTASWAGLLKSNGNLLLSCSCSLVSFLKDRSTLGFPYWDGVGLVKTAAPQQRFLMQSLQASSGESPAGRAMGAYPILLVQIEPARTPQIVSQIPFPMLLWWSYSMQWLQTPIDKILTTPSLSIVHL